MSESFLQPVQTPSQEKLHKLDIEAHNELKAVKDSLEIWAKIDQKIEPELPETKAEATRYIEKLEYLKDHIAKPYSPLEKRVLYNNVDAYIAKLQEITDTDEEMKMAA